MRSNEAPEPWAMHQVSFDCGKLKGRQVDITYIGSNGGMSGRRICVEAVSCIGGTFYLEAYCSLRGEKRTFAVLGIRQVVETDTGRVFSNAEDWLEEAGIGVWHGQPPILFTSHIAPDLECVAAAGTARPRPQA